MVTYWPISASIAPSSRARTAGGTAAGNSTLAVGWFFSTASIVARRRAIWASSAARSPWREDRSASASVGSRVSSTSPAWTRLPFSTAMVWTLPVSKGCTTFERPEGWMRAVATAWMSILAKMLQTSAAPNIRHITQVNTTA